MGTHPVAVRFVRGAIVVGAFLSALLINASAWATDGTFSGNNSGELNQNINANCNPVPNTGGLAAQTTSGALQCTDGICSLSATTTISSVSPAQTFSYTVSGLEVGTTNSGTVTGDNGISGSFLVSLFQELSPDQIRLQGQLSGTCNGPGLIQADYTATHFRQLSGFGQSNLTSGADSSAFRDQFRNQINTFNFPVYCPSCKAPAQQLGDSSDGFQVLPLAGGRGIRVQGQPAGDGAPWPWGIWGSYQRMDFEDDFAATAFDADSDTFVLGADVSLWQNVVTGVAIGFDQTDMDTTFNGGEAEIDSVLVIPYFGIFLSDYLGVDFDLTADMKIGYANVDVDQFRTAAGTRITSSSDADRLFFAGRVNAARGFGNWRLGGNAGWLVAREERDAFTESDGTAVARATTEFGQLSVGGDLSYLWNSFEPFARANYNLDYEREKTVVAGALQPANDNDEVVFGAGLRWFSNAGVTAVFEWSTVLGREDFDSDTYMFILRGDF